MRLKPEAVFVSIVIALVLCLTVVAVLGSLVAIKHLWGMLL